MNRKEFSWCKYVPNITWDTLDLKDKRLLLLPGQEHFTPPQEMLLCFHSKGNIYIYFFFFGDYPVPALLEDVGGAMVINSPF